MLFDFGGVILSSPFEAFAHYEADRGLPHGFIRSVNAADHHTNAWARLERSEISPDEFAAAFEEESAAMGHRVPGWDVLGLLAGEVRITHPAATSPSRATKTTSPAKAAAGWMISAR